MSDLEQGLVDLATARCQAWVLKRRDGVTFGFTDHDEDLVVDGVTCLASSGLSAVALSRSNGLAVDNSEAIGALTAGILEERDIAAGRYDDAEIWIWSVNWEVAGDAVLRFRGSLGEISRVDGTFRAEIRGLSESLNRVTGRVFQASCDAVLGDGRCGVDLSNADFRMSGAVVSIDAAGVIEVADTVGYPERWFERGVLRFGVGAQAQEVRIKLDGQGAGVRRLKIWADLPEALEIGAEVQITAGCDKAFATCRTKFSNAVNFQGFPTIPGEDWMLVYPNPTQQMDGGKL